MASTKKYYPPNAFRICVDTMEEDIAGRIYSPLSAETIYFVSAGEMLVKMDELFDHFGYPQAFQDKRSFDSEKDSGNLYRGMPETQQTAAKIVKQSGRKKTFDMIVKSRQNTSWQGALYDMEGNLLTEFDGEVELLSVLVKVADAAE